MQLHDIAMKSDRLCIRLAEEVDNSDSNHPSKDLIDEMIAFIEEVRLCLPTIKNFSDRNTAHILIRKFIKRVEVHTSEPIRFCLPPCT